MSDLTGPRLIASDIDGTLLHDGAITIDPVIFQEIRRLRGKGILFCPASGRQWPSLRALFAPVADGLYFLPENGSAVFGPGGEVLGKTVMDRPLAEELCRDIAALPGCVALISGVRLGYLYPEDQALLDYMHRDFVGETLAFVPAPADVPEDIIKVAAYCPQGSVAVEPLLSPKWSTHFHVAVAGELWLDFTLADKGTGVRQLCAALGIGLEDVMAFGDNYNDLPMLESVGLPYIMDNAVPDLRRRFPRHCRRVEDVLRLL